MSGEAPLNTDEFIERLQNLHDTLPRRLRQCAEYAARHHSRLAQATVSDFARGAGVPASAVVRFSQVMGFTGYAEMRALFRSPFLMPRIDYSERLAELRERGGGRPSGLLADFIETSRLSLDRLVDTVDSDSFDAAARSLALAGMIHVIGFDRCLALAAQAAHVLDRMEVPIVLHGAMGRLPGPHVMRPGDAVLLVAISPIPRELLEFCGAISAAGTQLVVVTDPGVAMHLRQRALCLYVSEAETAGFRTLSAMQTLVVGLSVAVGSVHAGRDL